MSDKVMLTWGALIADAVVEETREPGMSRGVVEALAGFLQQPEFSSEETSPFLVVEVVRTGQIWVYEVAPFLQNLAHVPATRECARKALERLRPEAG